MCVRFVSTPTSVHLTDPPHRLMILDIPSSDPIEPSSPTRSEWQGSPSLGGGDTSRESSVSAAGNPASSTAGHKRSAESQDLSQYALSVTRRVRLKPSDAQELMAFTKVRSVNC